MPVARHPSWKTFQLLPGLTPALCRQLNLPRQIGRACVFVQQTAVGIGLEQGLMLMLAVDIDQQFAKRFQVALRAGRAVDVRARAAFCGDDPAQNAGTVIVQVALLEPDLCFGNVFQIERGEDVSLVGTWTNHAAVGPVAQRQAQRVEHDGFASAGFASDYAHASIKLEIEVFDDGVVMYGKVHQH